MSRPDLSGRVPLKFPTPWRAAIGAHWLYVLYDADGAACYVGHTNDLRKRLKVHARDKDFVRWTASWDHECTSSRPSGHCAPVLRREGQLIASLKPYLNRPEVWRP